MEQPWRRSRFGAGAGLFIAVIEGNASPPGSFPNAAARRPESRGSPPSERCAIIPNRLRIVPQSTPSAQWVARIPRLEAGRRYRLDTSRPERRVQTVRPPADVHPDGAASGGGGLPLWARPANARTPVVDSCLAGAVASARCNGCYRRANPSGAARPDPWCPRNLREGGSRRRRQARSNTLPACRRHDSCCVPFHATVLLCPGTRYSALEYGDHNPEDYNNPEDHPVDR